MNVCQKKMGRASAFSPIRAVFELFHVFWKAKLKVGGTYLSLVARTARVILKILQANNC